MLLQQKRLAAQYIGKRFISKKLDSWQSTNKENAHQYFEECYSHFYGGQWLDIRLALRSAHTYAALVNNFHDAADKTKKMFESMGAIDILDSYQHMRAGTVEPNFLYRQNFGGYERRTTQHSNRRKLPDIDPSFRVNIVPEKAITLPSNLSIYTNRPGDQTALPRTTKNKKGIQSHFLLDGASIVPPLILNVQPGDRVYDACSAPGGKSLLLLQSQLPAHVVCNDLKRSKRIVDMFQHYLPQFQDEWNNQRCEIREKDARGCREYEEYDKILVDVPCSTDRHAVAEGNNFLFRPVNNDKLERLPTIQTEILTNCIRMLKPGGSLVYSTCSLNPAQNDDVVETALWRAFSKHSISANVIDLYTICRSFKATYKFYNGSKLIYGHLIVPSMVANYGPMYFSKITRST